MKQNKNYVMVIMLSALMAGSAFAQTEQGNKNGRKSLNDRTLSDRLQKDFYKRNSTFTDQPISWYGMGDDYYGTYSNNEQNYMARYDKQGNYVETMTEKEWNNNVPPSLKNSFESSAYKSQLVTSYWEVSDPERKGYYMELNDGEGKMSRVWANDQGEFTTIPYSKPRKKIKIIL